MAQEVPDSNKNSDETPKNVTELQNLKAAIDASTTDFWECKASDPNNNDNEASIIFDGCSMWNPKSYLVCQACHKKIRSEASQLPVQWRWSATDASMLNQNNGNNYDEIESLHHQWILYDLDSMITLEKNYQNGVSNFNLTILVMDDYGSNQRYEYKIDLKQWTQSRKSGGGRPRTIQRIDCNDYVKIVLDKNNSKDSKDICPICQCGFDDIDENNRDDDAVTLCDKIHIMHRSCAKLLVNSNNGVRCPQCRQAMKLPPNTPVDEINNKNKKENKNTNTNKNKNKNNKFDEKRNNFGGNFHLISKHGRISDDSDDDSGDDGTNDNESKTSDNKSDNNNNNNSNNNNVSMNSYANTNKSNSNANTNTNKNKTDSTDDDDGTDNNNHTDNNNDSDNDNDNDNDIDDEKTKSKGKSKSKSKSKGKNKKKGRKWFGSKKKSKEKEKEKSKEKDKEKDKAKEKKKTKGKKRKWKKSKASKGAVGANKGSGGSKGGSSSDSNGSNGSNGSNSNDSNGIEQNDGGASIGIGNGDSATDNEKDVDIDMK